eukprot:s419_g17.t1
MFAASNPAMFHHGIHVALAPKKSSAMGDEPDVIVVGAGISGLLCARDLLKQGFRVRVLEASERVGGRTYSVHFGDQRLDLGGQWIAPKQQQPQIRELIEDLGLELHPQHYAGKRILDLHCLPGPLQYSSDIPSGIGLGGLLMVQLTLWFCTLRARLSVGSGAERDATGHFARLDQQSTGEVLGNLVGNSGAGATRALVTAMVRGVFGCEPEELSWLHFLHYVACAGGVERLLKINNGFQESTVKGGAQQICEKLAEQVLALGAVEESMDSESDLEIDARVWHLRRSKTLVQAWNGPPSKLRHKDRCGSLLFLHGSQWTEIDLYAAARALSKGSCSYWIPAFAKPSSVLQRFALDVFHFHSRRLGWSLKRLKALGDAAGAELWAQRRSPDHSLRELAFEFVKEVVGLAELRLIKKVRPMQGGTLLHVPLLHGH